jgi:WD40 repeat protein
MGVLDLAIDPTTYPPTGSQEEEVVLFSAGSDRSIRRWAINTNLTSAKEIESENAILAHETSVYNLCFDSDSDLWTASADGTVKCLSRSREWAVDTTLEHGDYVRAVAVDEVGGWVVSAGRDEDVKVWDKSSGELKFVLEGHFEEVTGLVIVGAAGGNQRERWIVSVGIDATIRRWRKAVREVEDERNGVVKEKEVVDETQGNPFGIDEEEQRVLDELMNDSE